MLVFLLLFSACSLELSEEESTERLVKIAGKIPSASVSSISLSKGVSDGSVGYYADLELTWSGKEGRFSTEKALDKYSSEYAAEVTKRVPTVAMLSLSWVVPFHAEDEPAMVYSYQRRKSGLTQIGLQDRFTDGTFGADAFIDPDAMVTVPVRRVSDSKKSDKKEAARKEASPPLETAAVQPEGSTPEVNGGVASPEEGAADENADTGE